jgi:hypothetical protein
VTFFDILLWNLLSETEDSHGTAKPLTGETGIGQVSNTSLYPSDI